MDNKSVKVLNSLSEMASNPRIPSMALIPNRKITEVQSHSPHGRHSSPLSSGQPSQTRSSSHSSQNSLESSTQSSLSCHTSQPSQPSHSSQVYTPRLKKVLKSYQASAITSLNGPDWPHRMSSVPSVPPNRTTPPMSGISLTGNESKRLTKLTSNRLSNQLLSKTTDSSSHSKIDSNNRFTEKSSQSSTQCVNRNKSGAKGLTNNGLKGESYDPFLLPPPFPIQQPPIFTPPDQYRCERSETILEAETISCFTVGGEKRLCLPQILTTVLRDFSLPQINSVCDDLQIFCSRCTTDQLEVLKIGAIIPASAPSCGLITKTDAERLCAALLYANPPKASISSAINGKQLFTFKVYHECFGKCIGLYVPALYVQPFSTCIECLECHGLFAPQKFVCHSHRSRENRTCHWGFDSSNWRAYLLLAKDKHHLSSNQTKEDDTDIEENLNEMKARFDFKRKIAVSRDENPVCDPIKRIKCEESSPSGLYSYPSYLFSPYGWAADPSLLMYWYPGLASGGSANNSSTLAARLSAFKPWSPNPLGNGKHLPQDLLQAMPQGIQGFNKYLQTNQNKFNSETTLLQKSEKIANKRLDRYVIEPSVGSAPQKTHDSSAFITEKALKLNSILDKTLEKSVKDKTLYEDSNEDSFSSNNTLYSENSNLSDEENSSAKTKSTKIFSNLESILNENKLSSELKLKIINEVQNIINKLSTIESTSTQLMHKKKILNEIQDKKSNESFEINLKTGKQCEEISEQCLLLAPTSGVAPVVSSCSPTLTHIKREPNSSPLLADPKINCVH